MLGFAGLVLFSVAVSFGDASLTSDPYSCALRQFPPANLHAAPVFNISLDTDPKDRWTEIMKANNYTAKIENLLNTIVQSLTRAGFGFAIKLFNKPEVEDLLKAALPKEFSGELQGMAQVGNVSFGDVFIANLMYEMSTITCTSVIMQKNGQTTPMHARNLDFGHGSSPWDNTTHTWLMTVLHFVDFSTWEFGDAVNWFKNGKLQFRSTQFLGFTGLLTAVKEGKFGLTINTRNMKMRQRGARTHHLPLETLISAVNKALDSKHGGKENGIAYIWKDVNAIFTRQLFEYTNSYEEALKLVQTSPLFAPVYITLSGAKRNEGCITARGPEKADGIMCLGEKEGAKTNEWFVLQTNSDWWTSAGQSDNRRKTGDNCMIKLRNATLSGNATQNQMLYSVINTSPVSH